MDNWSRQSAVKCIYAFQDLNAEQQVFLIDLLNRQFPPSVYRDHLQKRRQAQQNLIEAQKLLDGVSQKYPHCIEYEDIKNISARLEGYGIVLTAGGEGERLRLSLIEKGIAFDTLTDFTKATFPLPDFFEDFGALQINLALIAEISSRFKVDFPVVVTTGPPGSATDRVIPDIIAQHKGFGIQHLKIVCQGERLHLTVDERIAYQIKDGRPYPVTHPDETGGPIMKLKASDVDAKQTMLEWFAACGADKIIVLQATAVYHPNLIPAITVAAENHDGLGVGILRKQFEQDDPFGSFVILESGKDQKLVILEQAVCNPQTRSLKDLTGHHYLPYNTGFYAFDIGVLNNHALPDYATPPKEVLPGLDRSPKVGYAATDILALTSNPAVLSIQPDHYAVIKNVDDLARLSSIAKGFGLDEICRRVKNKIHRGDAEEKSG